jgi:hypothetical protein
MVRIIVILALSTSCVFAQPKPVSTEDAKASSSSKVAPSAVTVTKAPKKPQKVEEGSAGDDAYRVKINQLQGRVNSLKEKIFRTKTRLAILKESLLSTSIAGAEARLMHRNEMGSSFNLEKVIYSLDGTPIYSKVDADGDLDDAKKLQIFDGPIVPGNHTLSVVMVYRGNGFGIFSYLRGYVFTLRNSHTFHAEEGKRIQVSVVGYEKGGMTTDLKDRPDIRFENKLSSPGRGARDKAGNQ